MIRHLVFAFTAVAALLTSQQASAACNGVPISSGDYPPGSWVRMVTSLSPYTEVRGTIVTLYTSGEVDMIIRDPINGTCFEQTLETCVPEFGGSSTPFWIPLDLPDANANGEVNIYTLDGNTMLHGMRLANTDWVATFDMVNLDANGFPTLDWNEVPLMDWSNPGYPFRVPMLSRP